MFSKVICFVAIIAVACSAPQFPAGLNPALCPGFPICDNSLLHGTPPVPSYIPTTVHIPQNAHIVPTAHAYTVNFAAPAATTTTVGGDRYPAGVNPALCPNYPYCDTAIISHIPQVEPLPGFTSRLYPAGVSAASCPNYPLC